MRTYLFTVLIFSLISCNTEPKQKAEFAQLLNSCDSVAIVFYNGGDSLYFNTVDSGGVKMLTRLISGNQETLKDTCSALGELRYTANDQNLLTAPFALAKGVNQGCDYINYSFQNTTYRNKLAGKGHSLLNQIFTKNKIGK